MYFIWVLWDALFGYIDQFVWKIINSVIGIVLLYQELDIYIYNELYILKIPNIISNRSYIKFIMNSVWNFSKSLLFNLHWRRFSSTCRPSIIIGKWSLLLESSCAVQVYSPGRFDDCRELDQLLSGCLKMV